MIDYPFRNKELEARKTTQKEKRANRQGGTRVRDRWFYYYDYSE